MPIVSYALCNPQAVVFPDSRQEAWVIRVNVKGKYAGAILSDKSSIQKGERVLLEELVNDRTNKFFPYLYLATKA